VKLLPMNKIFIGMASDRSAIFVLQSLACASMKNDYWKIENEKTREDLPERLRLFSVIHVPARIHPLPVAQHEDFGDAATLLEPLAAGL